MSDTNATNSVTDPQGQSVDESASVEEKQPTEVVETKTKDWKDEDYKKAYFELEKEKGRLANEKYQAEQRAIAYEQAMAAQRTPVHEVKEETPEEIYHREFAQDPETAIVKYNQRLFHQKQAKEQATATANAYYQLKTGSVPGFEDFPDLEPTVTQLANYYKDLVEPSQLNSPRTLEVLTLMARGLKARDIANSARNEGARVASQKDSAKERAFMEGSSSSVAHDDSFNPRWSLEEMEKHIPYKKL